MFDRDGFDELLGNLDRPTAPRERFANDLRAQLAAELEPDHASGGEPATMKTFPQASHERFAPTATSRPAKLPWMAAFEIAAAFLLLLGAWQVADRFFGSPDVEPGGANQAAVTATRAATAKLPAASAASPAPKLNDGPVSMDGGDGERTGRQPGPAPSGKLSALSIETGDYSRGGFAPVALGDTLYRVASVFLSGDPNGAAKTETHLEAYDIATGKQRWSIPANIWGSPAVGNGRVFVFVNGMSRSVGPSLEAYNASDGSFLWRAPGGFPNGCCDAMFISPLVSNGTVYSASPDGTAYAVDESTGTVLWTSTAAQTGARITEAREPGVTLATAGQTTAGDGYLYLVNANADLAALNLKDGKLAWSVNISKKYGFASRQIQPFVDGTTVLLTVRATQSETQSSAASNRLIALKAKTGAPLWDTTLQDGARASGMAAAGAQVLITYSLQAAGNDVEAYDLKTGAQVWKYAGVENNASDAGVVLSGTDAYVTGRGGRLLKLDSQTGAGAIVYEDPTTTDQAVYNPVISDGRIVLDHGAGGFVILSGDGAALKAGS